MATRIVCILTAYLAIPSQVGELDPLGRPEDMNPGQVVRYYIWHDLSNVWHLRMTTDRDQHRFTGSIRVVGDGKVASLKPARVEGRGPAKDWWSLNAKRNAITLDLNADGQIDGFDFKMEDSVKQIQLQLQIDGENQLERILVGKKGVHPTSNRFTLTLTEIPDAPGSSVKP